MTRAKWVHKCNSKNNLHTCGVITESCSLSWIKVTCPKCLAKKPKPKQPKTNLSFELDGKVFIVERTQKGKVISQEEIDGEVVLKLLVHTLEEALKENKYEKTRNK